MIWGVGNGIVMEKPIRWLDGEKKIEEELQNSMKNSQLSFGLKFDIPKIIKMS